MVSNGSSSGKIFGRLTHEKFDGDDEIALLRHRTADLHRFHSGHFVTGDGHSFGSIRSGGGRRFGGPIDSRRQTAVRFVTFDFNVGQIVVAGRGGKLLPVVAAAG
jgi:hypothetical protein